MRGSTIMTTLKLTQIGNSVGVIVPEELLARPKLVKDDTVFVTAVADGITLSLYSTEIEQQMAAARRVMKKRRNALRELAR
jgi:putative addiction module antidote